MKSTGIDIKSKRNVIDHLLSRLESNRIKQCRHLKLHDRSYWIAECTKGMAEHQRLHPAASSTGYGDDEKAYTFPRCPEDCHDYRYIAKFPLSLEIEPSIIKRAINRCASFWLAHWKWIIGTLIGLGILVVAILTYCRKIP